MDEVARSIRVGSTHTQPHADRRRLGFALGGFVAGEGCFSVRTVRAATSVTDLPVLRFSFSVAVADRDCGLVEALHHHLGGAGSVRRAPPRRPHLQPTVSLQVTSIRDHVEATIPFAERFLLPVGRKYAQYHSWRDHLVAHRCARLARRGRRATICTTAGCGRPVRARGLCRGATGAPQATDVADFLAGFVAAEGTLVRTGRRFALRVSHGATDRATCELLARYLGVSKVTTFPRRRPYHDDEVTCSVQSLRELVEVVVPFLDEHLPASHKREQFVAWRTELLAYWDGQARRRRPCTVEGCDEPRGPGGSAAATTTRSTGAERGRLGCGVGGQHRRPAAHVGDAA